ncbi:MAG: NAD(+) diphosphatase [Desulfobacteraceae bacterium]|uniref:NAD(+) diphosphatase n=1 Tax=Candidatus Desulfacyla euxinica TaxID=2841693 RepID=A0A8J6N0R5_9DELT|nr:NAD(+) diphosphatase [Candidatus Desulfacyla euxinica]MBL6977453.1 NAD(+) diphosphatase [Desulfobacteraceae bacterium]MBL7218221.1 NAD(+) diphosphatase [Desulfobacteraceae bacterium]
MSNSERKRSFVPSVIPPSERCGSASWFVFCGNKLLVLVKDGTASLINARDLGELGLKPIRQHFLGTLDGRHCYSAELAENTKAPDGMTFHGLRELWALLEEDLLTIAGLARQIIHWDRTNQFCSRCGGHMEPETERRAKTCPLCQRTNFPRLSPAIIVAVVKANKLLLARAHRHPPGLYSVIAGFVEPGETLEDCVRREVKEETGVDVKEIRYFGSQPWPFPDSLMTGFMAKYAGGEIAIEKNEIEDAGWFKADSFPPIPPKITIARQLIDRFVAERSRDQ